MALGGVLAPLIRLSVQNRIQRRRTNPRPQVTPAELKVVLDRYASTEQLAMNGVTIAGVKYMFLSANERVVRAKKGQSGLHCIKTVQGAASHHLHPASTIPSLCIRLSSIHRSVTMRHYPS